MRLRVTLLERFFELLSRLNSARLRLRCGGFEIDAQGLVAVLAALVIMIALITLA